MRSTPFFRPSVASTLLLVCSFLAQPASAQTPAPTAPAATFPDAPSALPLVNGRPYRKPTRREDFEAYRREMIGTRPFISAGIRGGIEQARDLPAAWGQDFPGYLQRFGSAWGEAAVDTSVRYGIASALHQDTRYLICHHCTLGAKFENAFLAEFTARQEKDGHRVLSPAPIVATFSGPLVAYNLWYPPGYTTEQALKHSTFGFSTRILFHFIREVAFDHDTPAEKAAKKSAASTTP